MNSRIKIFNDDYQGVEQRQNSYAPDTATTLFNPLLYPIFQSDTNREKKGSIGNPRIFFVLSPPLKSDCILSSYLTSSNVSLLDHNNIHIGEEPSNSVFLKPVCRYACTSLPRLLSSDLLTDFYFCQQTCQQTGGYVGS